MKTDNKIHEIHGIIEKNLMGIMGKSAYNEKVKEAKDYLLKARKETKVDLSYKEIAATRINWLNENYKNNGHYTEADKTIDNGLFTVAGIELDD